MSCFWRRLSVHHVRECTCNYVAARVILQFAPLLIVDLDCDKPEKSWKCIWRIQTPGWHAWHEIARSIQRNICSMLDNGCHWWQKQMSLKVFIFTLIYLCVSISSRRALFASDLSLTTAPLADRACLSLTSSARFFLYALLRYRRDETEGGGRGRWCRARTTQSARGWTMNVSAFGGGARSWSFLPLFTTFKIVLKAQRCCTRYGI